MNESICDHLIHSLRRKCGQRYFLPVLQINSVDFRRSVLRDSVEDLPKSQNKRGRNFPDARFTPRDGAEKMSDAQTPGPYGGHENFCGDCEFALSCQQAKLIQQAISGLRYLIKLPRGRSPCRQTITRFGNSDGVEIVKVQF